MAKANPAKLSKLSDDERRFLTPGLKYVKGKPVSSNLPRTEDLRFLPAGELTKILKSFNVFGPWDSFVMDSMAYVQRMSTVPPNSVAMQRAVANLIDTSSNRALLGMTRRVSQQWSAIESIEGNVSQDMIWVTLDDSSTCPSCDAMSGEIKTYLEWQQEGGPGTICDGSHLCRCAIIRID